MATVRTTHEGKTYTQVKVFKDEKGNIFVEDKPFELRMIYKNPPKKYGGIADE